MHALCEMTTAKKKRSRREVQLNPRTGNREERGNVMFAGVRPPNNLRVDELFSREPGLRQKPPYARMEPEHGRNHFFNHRDQPVVAPHMKQFVTRYSVLFRRA